jgi:hypothetical protein
LTACAKNENIVRVFATAAENGFATAEARFANMLRNFFCFASSAGEVDFTFGTDETAEAMDGGDILNDISGGRYSPCEQNAC